MIANRRRNNPGGDFLELQQSAYFDVGWRLALEAFVRRK
jgi:hypothetical protein